MFFLWPHLRSQLEARTGKSGALEIFSVDHDATDTFARLAGVGVVLDRLRRSAAAGETPPAMLVVGLYSEEDLRLRLTPRVGVKGLFDWMGLRYLRFVFSEDELRSATAAAIAGRDTLPPLPTREELALSTANIRHWLERVVKGLAGEAAVFANAALGGPCLSPAMLEPGSALSPEHRDNLAALAAALRLAPAIADGEALSKALTNDVDALQRESIRLEEIKGHGTAAAPAALTEAAAALSAAGEALDVRMRAIAARFAKETR
jgi:hypothetical protein